MVTDSIKYIGVNDNTIDLFEGQYVVPEGISYNSYVILDEKTAVMDTVDSRASGQWLENLKAVLGERKPDYLVISHVEPDHSGSIKRLLEEYPDITLVGNAKTFTMLNNFFGELHQEKTEVKEGDSLPLGKHILRFFMAPMVHWPEVMVEYEESEKVLFSADAFGKFGTNPDADWVCDARRYYFNIVGKYGAMVQMLLKKLAPIDIQIICPLHGPVLKENLAYYIDKYSIWSSYQPEDRGVFIAYASIHGNTAAAAIKLADMLKEAGEENVVLADLSRTDMSEAVEDAFRYDRMVLAASSYDAGVFPPMEIFLMKLKSKAYQNRTVALIENGSWAPSAGKKMKEYIDGMKDIRLASDTLTILSGMNKNTENKLSELAEVLKNF
jgi:flavorubredoxin